MLSNCNPRASCNSYWRSRHNAREEHLSPCRATKPHSGGSSSLDGAVQLQLAQVVRKPDRATRGPAKNSEVRHAQEASGAGRLRAEAPCAQEARRAQEARHAQEARRAQEATRDTTGARWAHARPSVMSGSGR